MIEPIEYNVWERRCDKIMDHELEHKWKTEDAAKNVRKINRKAITVQGKL
jgi:hypothetical protein